MTERPTGEYGRSRGIALAQSLARAGLYIFRTEDAVRLRPSDVGPASIPYLLKVLTDAGWIIRLRRGLYAGTGKLPGGVDVPPFVIGTSLVTPSAIAYLSALAHHGLTDQMPRVITVVTHRKVTVPSMRKASPTGSPHLWHVAGLDFRYVVIVRKRFDIGLENVWIEDRFRVPITDRERSVLDLFASPRIFGGLGESLAVLERAVDDIDLDKLVEYAVRYDSLGAAKRLGWGLEQVGADERRWMRLLELPVSHYTALDPCLRRRGRRDRRWMIIDNRTEYRV